MWLDLDGFKDVLCSHEQCPVHPFTLVICCFFFGDHTTQFPMGIFKKLCIRIPNIYQSGCHGMSLVGFDYCSVDHSLLCMKHKLWVPFLTFRLQTFPPSFTGFEGCSTHVFRSTGGGTPASPMTVAQWMIPRFVSSSREYWRSLRTPPGEVPSCKLT